jgi:hypothetical protein
VVALADRHQRELAASAINQSVILERGYRTVTDATELLDLGFADYQARPGLLIPLRSPDGSNGRYALKPNVPRVGQDGKPRKYDYPAGQPPILDVPPRCLEQIGDASVPLLFTEGAKKADCAAGVGYCAINIWGVHSWYRNPEHGGFATIEPLPDWETITPTLDGRIVYLTYDSDAFSKDAVGLALRRLANWLARQGALVYIVHLPNEPDGSKNGLDDYVARYGAEAFADLVADAEPWGSIGMVRKLRARVVELEQLLSAQAAVMRNHGLRPTEKLVTIATIHEAGWAASAGKPTPYKVNYDRLAEASGASTQTVGSTIKALSDDGGLFLKTNTRELTEEGEWYSTVKLEPRHDGGVVGLLKAAAEYAPVRPGWGGKREPRCPDHPEAEFLGWSREARFACGCVVAEAAALKRQHDITDSPRGLVRFNGPEKKPAAIVAGLLERAFPDASSAVDLTPGAGCFWSEAEPVDVQVENSPHDFRALPYADDSYDVVVFDPPHNADCGAASVMGLRYGSYSQAELEQVIRQGVAEAWRVARLGVIVKVTEQIHAQRFQAERDWVQRAIGQPPYDLAHGQHAPMRQSAPLSVLNNGSTYLVFRKGDQRHVRRLKCQLDISEIASASTESLAAPTLRTTDDKSQVSDTKCRLCGRPWNIHGAADPFGICGELPVLTVSSEAA